VIAKGVLANIGRLIASRIAFGALVRNLNEFGLKCDINAN
jgi:hypothetical protein